MVAPFFWPTLYNKSTTSGYVKMYNLYNKSKTNQSTGNEVWALGFNSSATMTNKHGEGRQQEESLHYTTCTRDNACICSVTSMAMFNVDGYYAGFFTFKKCALSHSFLVIG